MFRQGMFRHSILCLLSVALVLSSCSELELGSSSGEPSSENSEAEAPVVIPQLEDFQPLKAGGSATLESLTAEVKKTRSVTQDVRQTLAPLLYLLPAGDYGVDEAWVISLGSSLKNTAGRSWRGGAYEIVMKARYQTDSTSYLDAVARVRAATFQAKNQLLLTGDNAWTNADPMNSDVEVTATELVFSSPDRIGELFTFVIKQDTGNPGLVEVEMTYSLSPDSDEELEQYMQKLSGWTQIYPEIEGGRIAKVEFNNFITTNSRISIPGKEAVEETIPLFFTFDYQFVRDESGEQSKDASILEAEIREDLKALNWTIGEASGSGQTFSATDPNGAEHAVTIDDFFLTHVEYFYRVEVPRTIN